MNQSNAIAGFMVLAFIVFITVRGELPIYMGLLLANPSNAPASGPSSQPQSSATDSLSKAADTLAAASKLLPLAL